MTAAVQNLPLPKCTVPLIQWTAKHPQLALITAIAFAALGIACAVATLTATLIPITAVALSLCAIPAFFLSNALFFAYAKRHIPIAQPPQTAEYLVKVIQDTLAVLKNGRYVSPDGQPHDLALQRVIEGTQLIASAGAPGIRPGNFQTKISVVSQDCLYAAKDLHKEGSNPIILDNANAIHPGGGYLRGARAQEEDLCRRSALGVAIDSVHGMQAKNFFPLNPQEAPAAGIYVPNAPVFRAGPDQHYQYLNEPFEVAFAVLAAPCLPALQKVEGRLRLKDGDAHLVRERIRTMLEMAYVNGHRSVVLGAFGCGAFCNPPDHVAEIFNEVIHSEYPGCFEEIVFAILDDHNAGREHNPEGNFLPFKRLIPD
jgi:uncharacterized protein (TIGR02452 family)